MAPCSPSLMLSPPDEREAIARSVAAAEHALAAVHNAGAPAHLRRELEEQLARAKRRLAALRELVEATHA